MQPTFKNIEKINFAKAKQSKLDNGIPIYLVNAGSQDVVKIEFLFSAGNYYQQIPLEAAVINAMLTEGTEHFSSSEIAEKLDYLGAYIQQSVDQDAATVSLLALKKHLPQALEIIEDVIKHPSFPSGELQTLLAKRKQQFVVDQTKVQYLAREKFNEKLFGGTHPYGQVLKAEHFDLLNPEQLLTFHCRYYMNESTKIIVSGKVDDTVVDLINKHFGNDILAKGSVQEFPSSSFQTTTEKHFFVEKQDAVQSAIRVGKMLVNRAHPDFNRLMVLNTVLGGYFGSRLMKNIREDKGYTYGIHSIAVTLQEAGYMVIVSEVGTDVCKEALKEIHLEIKKLREAPVSLEELQVAKNYMMGEVLRSFDGPFAISESVRTLAEYGLGYDYYDQMVSTIQNITPMELIDLANKYYTEGGMIEVVAGRE